MALFFTITLAVGIVGMLSILWLKRYELTTGRVLFAGVRPALGAFFGQVFMSLGAAVPGVFAREARRAWALARHFVHAAAALVVIVAEHMLERLLEALRYRTSTPGTAREASPFLREVAEHKKRLLKDRDDE